MNKFSKALQIALNVHADQQDKGGQDYIKHCLVVYEKVKHHNNEELNCIAILHDALEDCKEEDELKITNEIKELSLRVYSAVLYLTKLKDESDDEYLEGILCDRDAMIVKLADLEHNSDITRLKGLRTKDFARLEKYCKMYTLIKENYTIMMERTYE